MTKALLEALGTRQEPRNLLACLDRLRREPSLASQGFRTAGGFGPNLTLWPARGTRKPRRDPPILQRGHADRVTGTVFSADGSRMMTASMDSTLRIWHAAAGTLLRVLPSVTNGFRCLALSSDGRLLVAGGGNGDALFFDLQRDSAKTLTGAIPHAGAVDRVAILPVPALPQALDQKIVYHVLTLDNTGRSLIWDASESTVRRLNRPPTERGGRLAAVATRPGRVAFALVVPDGIGKESIRAFDFRGDRVMVNLAAPPGRISALSLSDDGSRLWAGTEEGTVAEFDLQTGNPCPQRKLEGAVTGLEATPSWLIAAAGHSISVLPWNQEAPGAATGNGVADRTSGCLARWTPHRCLRRVGRNAPSVGDRGRRHVGPRLGSRSEGARKGDLSCLFSRR